MGIKEKILDQFEKELGKKNMYYDEKITIEILLNDEEKEEFLDLNYFDNNYWELEKLENINILKITN